MFKSTYIFRCTQQSYQSYLLEYEITVLGKEEKLVMDKVESVTKTMTSNLWKK